MLWGTNSIFALVHCLFFLENILWRAKEIEQAHFQEIYLLNHMSKDYRVFGTHSA